MKKHKIIGMLVSFAFFPPFVVLSLALSFSFQTQCIERFVLTYKFLALFFVYLTVLRNFLLLSILNLFVVRRLHLNFTYCASK